MTGINGFTQYAQAAEVLIALKQSLLPECYRFTPWVAGTAGKEWEERVKRSSSCADIAKSYMELEAALKWGDSYPETERAFGDTWASRRPDWLAAMRGLAVATSVKVISPQEVMEWRWSRAMDEQLVHYIDEMANKSARRLMSLTFRDIEGLSKADADNPAYPLLRSVPIEALRARFALLKMISTDYMRVLPVVDLSLRASWSVSPLILAVSKTLIFQQSKMYLWRSMLGRLYSEERPQFVILNRHEAAKKRKDAQSRLHHSLFYQLYAHIGMLVDPSSLRRRGQAWMVKFVGEGGHDVGGLYNESLVDICNELQAEGNPNNLHAQLLPLFRLCPNGRHGVGENRNKYVPTSSSTALLHLSMFEFIGRLCGVCCLDNNRALPLDLCSMVWKAITSEPLTFSDLRSIDYHTYNTINIIRNPHLHKLNAETFEYLFPDLFFTTESTCGLELELCRGGAKRRVTFDNSREYADLLERRRLTEFAPQIDALCRGLASIIPYDFLSIFTSEQLEVLITGSPEIDLQLLKEKTEYRGNVNVRDRHIQLFWDALEGFTSEERTAFVQFVSGRSRLPSSALGFGKDVFKLSDHGQALTASSSAASAPSVDHYLPVAHTCLTGDHAVLTRSGWRSIRHIRVGDLVASIHVGIRPDGAVLEEATYELQWKRVTAVQSLVHEAEVEAHHLFRMQGDGMDVVATRDHSMLLACFASNPKSLQKERPLEYQTVGQLLDPQLSWKALPKSCRRQQVHTSRAVLRSAINRQPDVRLTIAGMEAVCEWWWEQDHQKGFLRFVGHWLSHGHLIVHDGYVAIAQRKLESSAWLIDLLDAVFPRWWHRHRSIVDAEGITPAHVISCPPLYEWLRVMAAGPPGYHALVPAAVRAYPHFQFDAELESLETQTPYRQPRTTWGTWTEVDMRAALRLGPVRRPCCVCDDASGDRLVCSGSGCTHIGAVTRAHPACVGWQEALWSRPWYCSQCGGVEEEWSSSSRVPPGRPSPAPASTTRSLLSSSSPPSPALLAASDERRSSFSFSSSSRTSTSTPRGRRRSAESGKVMAAAAATFDEGEEEVRVDETDLVWKCGLLDIDVSGQWYDRKRWMGPDVASTFANLSQQQAIALTEAFCRADGLYASIQYDESGAPVGVWRCSHSSRPLVDHLQLIGQLAGAAAGISAAQSDETGKAMSIDGREESLQVEHWCLTFDFNNINGAPVPSTYIRQPMPVSADSAERGYYQYEDDGRVYDISVEGNHNFFTQRLSRGEGGVRASTVCVGNCFFALELPRYSSKAVMRAKLLYAIRECVSIDGDATHEGRANMMMTWTDSD